MKEVLKFNKDIYWDRRKKGLHGQIHPPGSKEQRYDMRVVMKKIQADRLKKGFKNVRLPSKANT